MYTQKIKMSSEPESNAFRNMDFLIRLGSVKQQRERKEMLEMLTTEQLQGIGEVARCIARGQISILGQDWCNSRNMFFAYEYYHQATIQMTESGT